MHAQGARQWKDGAVSLPDWRLEHQQHLAANSSVMDDCCENLSRRYLPLQPSLTQLEIVVTAVSSKTIRLLKEQRETDVESALLPPEELWSS